MEQAGSSRMAPGGVTAGGSGTRQRIVNNPGNPVSTCPYPPDAHLPKIGGVPVLIPGWNQQPKPQHPMYSTSANSYGAKPPTVYDVPTQFFSRTQKFSQHLGECGMYRNHSLNTETDKSKV
eukprot:TRINITY_DN19483_c0_g1_i1.p1 TRINITY_DN19483_c0_g1~~TRINITY_DN19483_c0_g1_i1.p1  ORF type:complete len:121 (-),score=19.70 TRINITY_DN19483_c0_g1_i1:245-607(-)